MLRFILVLISSDRDRRPAESPALQENCFSAFFLTIFIKIIKILAPLIFFSSSEVMIVLYWVHQIFKSPKYLFPKIFCTELKGDQKRSALSFSAYHVLPFIPLNKDSHCKLPSTLIAKTNIKKMEEIGAPTPRTGQPALDL